MDIQEDYTDEILGKICVWQARLCVKESNQIWSIWKEEYVKGAYYPLSWTFYSLTNCLQNQTIKWPYTRGSAWRSVTGRSKYIIKWCLLIWSLVLIYLYTKWTERGMPTYCQYQFFLSTYVYISRETPPMS